MKTRDPFLRRPDQQVTLHGRSFPLEWLYRGLLVTGQPGSGKTRCVLLPLLHSILVSTGIEPESKCCMLINDPKNELAPIVERMLTAIGRTDDLIVLKPGLASYNPLGNPLLTPTEIPEKIISWSNNTHRNAFHRAQAESEFWANSQRALLSALLSATRTVHGELTFPALNNMLRRITRFDGATEATKWLQERSIPESAISGISDFLRLPRDTTRSCVANSVSSVIYYWENEPLAGLVTSNPLTTVVDPFDVIHTGKIVIVGCSGAAFGGSITPFTLALKEHFLASLLSRDQIEIETQDGWMLINQTRPVFVVSDEFQASISTDSSTGELTALDRLRGFNSGMICATQNISSLESVLGNETHARRLISLLSNQIYLGNICPTTGAMAEHIFGKKKTSDFQRDVTHSLAPPSLFREPMSSRKQPKENRVEITRQASRVDATTLARLKTGEYWLRLASGQIHHQSAPSTVPAWD